MAEAILFAHRSLRPLIDLQDSSRRPSASPSACRSSSPPRVRCSTSSTPSRRRQDFVVVDVETTGTDPKLADLVEIGAVKVKGGKVTDRWSTLVNPGRPIVGNQVHGITDKDVKGAPSAKDAAKQFLDFAGDDLIVAHNVGFDLGFIEEALGDGYRFQPGRYLDTLVIARDAYPDRRSVQAVRSDRLLRPRGEPAPRRARRRGRPRRCSSASPRTCRPESRPQGRYRRLHPRHSAPAKLGRRARGRQTRGRRQQGPVQRRPEEDRPRARARRGHPHGWPRRWTRSGRSRSRSDSCRAPMARRLFTRGDTQALTVATLGPSSRRPAHRHHQPGD